MKVTRALYLAAVLATALAATVSVHAQDTAPTTDLVAQPEPTIITMTAQPEPVVVVEVAPPVELGALTSANDEEKPVAPAPISNPKDEEPPTPVPTVTRTTATTQSQNPTGTPTTDPKDPPTDGTVSQPNAILIGVLVGVPVGALVICVLVSTFRRCCRPKRTDRRGSSEAMMGGANMSQQPQHAFGRVVPGGAAGAHMAHRANPYMNHPQQQQQATAGSISYLEYEVEASNDETMLPTMPRMDAPPANNRMNSPNRVSSPPNRTPSPQNPYMAQMQQQQQQQQQGYYQY